MKSNKNIGINPFFSDNKLEGIINTYINSLEKISVESDDETFSWVFEGDKKFICKNTINSVNYGIPNHVIGNKENAELFICLYNPSIQVKYGADKGLHDKEESLAEYIEIEKANSELEYDTNKDYYRKHIESSENILYQEILRMSKEEFPKNDADRKQYYYLYAYFYPLFSEQRIKAFNIIIKELQSKNKDDFLQRVKDYKICNLELLPYRSKKKSDIKFTKELNSYNDIPTSNYSISIVVNRIIKSIIDEESVKPKFIFRSYTQWIEGIKEYLRNNMSEIDEILVKRNKKSVTFEDLLDYFYVFKNPQSARITKSNICKITSINDQEFAEIKKLISIK